MAAQLRATKGRSARALQRWIARARRSLPVPVSPRISTGVSVTATWRAWAARARTTGCATARTRRGPPPARRGRRRAGAPGRAGATSASRCSALSSARAEDLPVGLDEVDDRLAVDLAAVAVEGQDAERAAGGVQRDDHARVAGREVEHAVERVAVAVAVVVLGERAGAAGLERLAQAGEIGEVEAMWPRTGAASRPRAARTTRLRPSSVKIVARS
jgi:hypothetical protein